MTLLKNITAMFFFPLLVVAAICLFSGNFDQMLIWLLIWFADVILFGIAQYKLDNTPPDKLFLSWNDDKKKRLAQLALQISVGIFSIETIAPSLSSEERRVLTYLIAYFNEERMRAWLEADAEDKADAL